MRDRAEFAEGSAIPFSRENLAAVIGVPKSNLNNWLTRNQLWQTHRGLKFHRHYTIKELFDLGGFATMRDAGIPEIQCAQFVRNFGFYRSFLSADGRANFSRKQGEWQIGVFDPNAPVTLSLNIREIGVGLMTRLCERLMEAPESFPRDALNDFASLYRTYVACGFLPPESVSALEAKQ